MVVLDDKTRTVSSAIPYTQSQTNTGFTILNADDDEIYDFGGYTASSFDGSNPYRSSLSNIPDASALPTAATTSQTHSKNDNDTYVSAPTGTHDSGSTTRKRGDKSKGDTNEHHKQEIKGHNKSKPRSTIHKPRQVRVYSSQPLQTETPRKEDSIAMEWAPTTPQPATQSNRIAWTLSPNELTMASHADEDLVVSDFKQVRVSRKQIETRMCSRPNG